MQPIALFIAHRTLPGQRDAVRAVWEQHMAPAITDNAGHLAYHYCFEPSEPDVICAFQLYRGDADTSDFLATTAYRTYEREVTPLLAGAPDVRRLSPVWTKAEASSRQTHAGK